MKAIMKSLMCVAMLLPPTAVLHAAEFHVAVTGKDANPGTQTAPLRTIQRGANLAQPGDVITVHAGVYRQRINPPRGGESDAKRIVYQAAPGEKVEIKGSEVVKNWVKVQDDTWKATLPNSFFGTFNPYSDLLHGDWFDPAGRMNHTGAVYLNGEWLRETYKLEDVMKPAGDPALWYAQVDQANTTIRAQFKGVNPNEQLVEINVRRTVFYPDKPGRNYITVRGFTMRHAATPWSPPTAEQIGLVGTHWSKWWIIENNVISHSTCVGVTLGKYGDEWDNKGESNDGYIRTIKLARENGWSKDNIGRHLVRNNTISHCEQSGIVGSLGAVFSTITGNTIHDIRVRGLFGGAEMAGIKLHAAIDVTISGNHIYRTCRGIWLDWMGQGTRITRNLFHDNEQDLFFEVNHGPILVDNNILLSRAQRLLTNSQGVALVHNLMVEGMGVVDQSGNQTPLHKPHTTEFARMHGHPSGDDRYYNNLVAHGDLSEYDTAKLPVWMSGNVFLKGAKPSKHDPKPLVRPDFDPALKLVEKADGLYLEMTFDKAWSAERTRKGVTTQLLGKAAIPNQSHEHPDGTPLSIDTDYSGKKRNENNPFPGPFEISGGGKQTLNVWKTKETNR